jgi:hypothetical protein|tara:strand:- start:107 stop:487 length:381 start_codon:yes stop_codon:yes gene_type:complete
MRGVFFFLLVFTVLKGYSQDTVQIPQDELNNFFLSVDTLKEQDSIKTVLISDLELQIKNFNLLSNQDSLILSYKNQEIDLLRYQIKLYDDRLNQIDKWYKKPWIGVVSGVVATLITIHVIDYSLPK